MEPREKFISERMFRHVKNGTGRATPAMTSEEAIYKGFPREAMEGHHWEEYHADTDDWRTITGLLPIR